MFSYMTTSPTCFFGMFFFTECIFTRTKSMNISMAFGMLYIEGYEIYIVKLSIEATYKVPKVASCLGCVSV